RCTAPARTVPMPAITGHETAAATYPSMASCRPPGVTVTRPLTTSPAAVTTSRPTACALRRSITGAASGTRRYGRTNAAPYPADTTPTRSAAAATALAAPASVTTSANRPNIATVG